jgi:hypothetical protein
MCLGAFVSSLFCSGFFVFCFHLEWAFVYFTCRYGDPVSYFAPILVLVIDEYEMSYELNILVFDCL